MANDGTGPAVLTTRQERWVDAVFALISETRAPSDAPDATDGAGLARRYDALRGEIMAGLSALEAATARSRLPDAAALGAEMAEHVRGLLAETDVLAGLGGADASAPAIAAEAAGAIAAIGSDEIVELAERNPFGVPLAIRAPLEALGREAAALAASR